MPINKDFYQLLGLPRTATTEEIKKRYRELARKYHPDVAKDKQQGQKFVEILEAYKTLVDPRKRADYDRFHPAPEPPPGTHFDSRSVGGSSTQTGRTTTASRGSSVPPGIADLIRDAQFSFIKRRFNEAANLCKKAIAIEHSTARAHAILGDVYLAQGKTGKAIDEYSHAVEYDPSDQESIKKLEKLVKSERPAWARRFTEPDEAPVPPRPKARVTQQVEDKRKKLNINPKSALGTNLIGSGLALALLLIMSHRPGQPIYSLKSFLPLIDTWSWNLIVALAVSSGVMGALFMTTGLLNHPDEELIFDENGVFPVGSMLLLFAGIFFWGAAAVYMIIGLVMNGISTSILKVFAVVTAIVLLAGFLYPIGSDQVWLFGGNIAFIGALAGWYIAAMARPLSD